MNSGWGISYEIALRWMPVDLTDDKSTLVQVMAWCHHATSHYLSQCWPRSMSPNSVTRPEWVKITCTSTSPTMRLELNGRRRRRRWQWRQWWRQRRAITDSGKGNHWQLKWLKKIFDPMFIVWWINVLSQTQCITGGDFHIHSDHSGHELGQWEKALHSNGSSHWLTLSPYAEWSLVHLNLSSCHTMQNNNTFHSFAVTKWGHTLITRANLSKQFPTAISIVSPNIRYRLSE